MFSLRGIMNEIGIKLRIVAIGKVAANNVLQVSEIRKMYRSRIFISLSFYRLLQ